MSLPTPQHIADSLREQVRALKKLGLTYAEIGEEVERDGKPIGKALAFKFGGPREGEKVCGECLRRLGKRK